MDGHVRSQSLERQKFPSRSDYQKDLRPEMGLQPAKCPDFNATAGFELDGGIR